MLEEKGVVVAVEDNLVWVQTEIKTTCGSCAAKANCATSSIAKAFSAKPNVISLTTDFNVKVGDSVVIGIEEGFVMQSAFYVYLLPIFGFILFAYIGELLLPGDGKFKDGLEVLVAFFGGWLGFLLAKRQLKQRGCEQNSGVKLLKIVNDHIPITVKP